MNGLRVFYITQSVRPVFFPLCLSQQSHNNAADQSSSGTPFPPLRQGVLQDVRSTLYTLLTPVKMATHALYPRNKACPWVAFCLLGSKFRIVLTPKFLPPIPNFCEQNVRQISWLFLLRVGGSSFFCDRPSKTQLTDRSVVCMSHFVMAASN